MGWETTGFLSTNTILTVLGPLGIGIGNLAGGILVRISGGPRKMLIISNAFAVLGCGLTLVEWLPALVVGRLLFSICAGIQQFC